MYINISISCKNITCYRLQMSPSMSPSMPSMVVRMMSLSTILHIHNCPPIPTISMVDNMLDTSIRESHGVLSLHAATLVTRPLLTEVGVVLVIVHTILKVEGVRSFIINISTMATPMSNNTIRNRKAENMKRE